MLPFQVTEARAHMRVPGKPHLGLPTLTGHETRRFKPLPHASQPRRKKGQHTARFKTNPDRMTFTFTCDCGKQVRTEEPPFRNNRRVALCDECKTKYLNETENAIGENWFKFAKPVKHIAWKNGRHITR